MKTTNRIVLRKEPFVDQSQLIFRRGAWPANWVEHSEVHGTEPAVVAYRRILTLDRETKFRLHVSADERYELFINGECAGRGPERGDRHCWFFESYDVTLPAGRHVIVARTWWIGADAISSHAQVTVRPAFLCAAEGLPAELLNTGVAPWECKRLGGYEFVSPEMAWGTSAKTVIHGATFDWGCERGDGEGWQPVRVIGPAFSATEYFMAPDRWLLCPAMLPAMLEESRQAGIARHVQAVNSADTTKLPVCGAENLRAEVAGWNRLLAGTAALTIPPQTMRRVIVDLQNYFCVYPQLAMSGGEGASVRLFWAESLFTEEQRPDGSLPPKGNRDEIEGKFFSGIGDTFYAAGGPPRRYEPLWWEAGRYVEIVVATGTEALTIEQLTWLETGYPYKFDGQFEFGAPGWSDFVPIAKRALQMCSHETYMDCPYYEQMMYVGDTRLEVLTTYTLTHDDRLPRKAVRLFDESRLPTGLTQARYPCRWPQVIPPFSLYWIAMVHDFALWRDDPGFVRERLPGVRAVIEAFAQRVNADGLLEAVQGWNFVDWVPAWGIAGLPADAEYGISGILNWHFAYTLRLAAELEDAFGEPELAARDRRLAGQIATAAFWDESRGLFADDLAKKNFSEHAQCFAILAGDRRTRLDTPGLARATIYFTHYVFEASRVLGQIERVFERMPLWFDLKERGLRTTVEMPEPTRSDCHAWGAHPVYHAFATILGIRPASFGFRSVRIEPQLGPLPWARGSLPHPRGFITVDLAAKDGRITGVVELPTGVAGTFVSVAGEKSLHAGQTKLT